MKKSIIIGMSALLIMSSCGSYTGTGAYMGTTLGSIFGSAIGGIAGGPRGSDIGTVVGMVGGAVAGAAVGQAADQKRQSAREADRAQYEADRAERAAARAQRNNRNNFSIQSDNGGTYSADNVGGDIIDTSNSGDDRIYNFNGTDYTGNYSAKQPEVTMPMQSSVENLAGKLKYAPNIVIKNARFVDDNQDGKIERGEMSKVIFEVYNRGQQTLHDVVPTVLETSGNKHIFISQNLHVEEIQPGKGIRYTALVKADNRLKNGTAKICVSVVQGGKSISKVNEFDVPTVK